MLHDTLMLASALASVPESMLDPMGPVAAEQKAHLIRVISLTMIAIVPVLIGVPLLYWRYRRRPNSPAAYTPNWGFSGWLELVAWGVPILIILSLASVLVYSTRLLDPAKPIGPNPIRIEAIGLNWKWVFIYPEQGVATIDQLVVPVGRPVELVMTSDTVMLSPQAAALNGQIYVMPGMVTRQNFQADKSGTTMGRNMMYNGIRYRRRACCLACGAWRRHWSRIVTTSANSCRMGRWRAAISRWQASAAAQSRCSAAIRQGSLPTSVRWGGLRAMHLIFVNADSPVAGRISFNGSSLSFPRRMQRL